MELALLLLLIAGPVGAIDVIYFHLWKFRLYERPESVNEEITHILRGFLAPTLTGILLLGNPQGLWFWAVAAFFMLDALNSLLDVLAEPRSRAPRGVPPSELAVHFVGISMMGAATALYLWGGWETRLNITAIVPPADNLVPANLRMLALLALPGAFALTIFEAYLFVRAIWRRRTQSRMPATSTR